MSLGPGLLSVTTMLDFSGKANTSIHGLGEDDTASPSPLSLASEVFENMTPTAALNIIYEPCYFWLIRHLKNIPQRLLKKSQRRNCVDKLGTHPCVLHLMPGRCRRHLTNA